MQLKQATTEATVEAPMHRHQTRQERQIEQAHPQGQRRRQNKAATKTALPTAKNFLSAAALGLLCGLLFAFVLYGLAAVVSNGDHWQRRENDARYIRSWADDIVISQVTALVYILLPLLLSFWLGWKQRDGVKAAAVCLVLAVAFVLGFTACLKVAALLHYYYAFPSSVDTTDGITVIPAAVFSLRNMWPRNLMLMIAPLQLAVGAVGGICGKTAQAMAARSRKNNR